MVTYSQINKIKDLKNLLNLDFESFDKLLMSFGVHYPENLTYTEASIILEILQNKYKKYKSVATLSY